MIEQEPEAEAPAATGGPARAMMERYLPDLVYGANDGVITTFAVVSGVVGAALSPTVILLLGFANLLADGVSMAASNVLSRRSDARQETTLVAASRHGLATFVGFLVAGVAPLLAYVLPGFERAPFGAATALSLGTLFAVGAGRALFIARRWLPAGLEMLAIGAVAGAIAYGVGAFGAWLLGAAPLA